MLKELSLLEYRLHHPHTAQVPTLTQSSVLGLVLERQRRNDQRLAFYHSLQVRASAALLSVFNWCKPTKKLPLTDSDAVGIVFGPPVATEVSYKMSPIATG